eukprot:TRINITY_DN22791_c0_g1_i1.p1 TRINITY_DN22791_c0_g1~~TRINITY_DN22791_c0_g1_i1.p1  ORF type:complete len:132 (-),score=14.87 TRINITY_DN22791_c0_g1_i1:107-502(-)
MSLRRRGLVSNELWFSPFVARGLKLSPYPVNMYLFEHALAMDDALRQCWQRRDHLYDEPAERLQNHFRLKAASTQASLRFLQSGATPVHKLNWRQDVGSSMPGSNLEALFGMHLNEPTDGAIAHAGARHGH